MKWMVLILVEVKVCLGLAKRPFESTLSTVDSPVRFPPPARKVVTTNGHRPARYGSISCYSTVSTPFDKARNPPVA